MIVNKKEKKIKSDNADLSEIKGKLKVIYGSEWSNVLGFLCNCTAGHIRLIFSGEKRDYYGARIISNKLIDRGNNWPKNVQNFLKNKKSKNE